VRKLNIIILFVVSINILVIAGIFIYRLTTDIIKENEEIGNLTNLYEQLEEVRLGIRTAIINQKDFTLTGDTLYKFQYKSSKESTIAQFQSLKLVNKQNLITNDTFDSLNLLLNINFKHLDELILLGEIEDFDDIEDYINHYSSEIFKEFSNINKTIENNIESRFNRFRFETAFKARRLELFVVSFYSFSILSLLICFYLIYKQNNLRLWLVKELKESNNLKDKFFSIIAHDLRSPFTFLINLSTLVSETEIANDEKLLKSALKNIEDTSKKTFNLLNNLLEWANSQTNKLRVNKEWFNIQEEITEILDLYSDIITKKQIEIKYTPQIINAFADKNMIKTVIRNLIGNAIKFVPENGEISIQVNSTDSFNEILIIDNGSGLSQQDIAKLFRLDVDTKFIGNAENKGSGLGLILCKEFIEKHGGKIFARANSDKGCTFGFEIPKN